MKFGRALALGIALSALSAASGIAQVVGSDEPYTGPNGPYLRAEGGWSHENDMKGQGSTGLNFNSKEDDGFMAGGAAGWKFGQLRAELGLDFSGHDVSSIHVNSDGGLGALRVVLASYWPALWLRYRARVFTLSNAMPKKLPFCARHCGLAIQPVYRRCTCSSSTWVRRSQPTIEKPNLSLHRLTAACLRMQAI